MTGWIVLAAYVGGFLFTYRRGYLALMENDEQKAYRSPDNEDRVMNAVMAMMGALMWPLTLVGFALWRFATPVTPGQRKADLDAREREIERLEREVGIHRGRRITDPDADW